MNLEKCKFCAYAMFDTHIVGWTCKDGKSVELREQDDYPTSCSFGIDGARPIDNYCSKEGVELREINADATSAL